MEEGFYTGTTSIGYVLILLLVLLPVVLLAIAERLSEGQAIAVGAAGTVLAAALLYPALLGWVLGSYYACFPERLPANGGTGPENVHRADPPAR
jgi:hypothetical protein